MTTLLKNDLFKFEGKTLRVLDIDAKRDVAIVIEMFGAKALPFAIRYSDIQEIPFLELTKSPGSRVVSQRQAEHAAVTFSSIKTFVSDYPAITDANYRARSAKEIEEKTGLTRQTIYKNARKYWQGGQTEQSLYPAFDQCGRMPYRKMLEAAPATEVEEKSNKHDGKKKLYFTISAGDIQIINAALKNHYLKIGGQTLAETVKRIHDDSYSAPNANNIPILFPKGAKPTYQQIYRFLHSTYSDDTIAISRFGQKEHDKNRRSVTGRALDASIGPGHVYEVDAYTCDIYVTDEKRVFTVGRPNLYLIRDRDTGLHVGMYMSLSPPSWMGAALAILNIFEDKANLCLKHGIPYNKDDWPAHGLMPSSIAADRGEFSSMYSCTLTTSLKIAVTLLPGGRPDMKGSLETEFGRKKIFFQTLEYGYTESREAHEEYKGQYTAAITYSEFQSQMWERLVHHNKRAGDINKKYKTLEERLDEVIPSPINLWNYRHPKHPSLVSRHSLNDVKFSILPQSVKASITPEGISFEGRLYVNKELETAGVFNRLRAREKIRVIYDPRDTNSIWPILDDGRIVECTLSTRSPLTKNMTDFQVAALAKKDKEMKARIDAYNSELDATRRFSAHNLREKVKQQRAGQPKISRNAKVSKIKMMGQQIQKADDSANVAKEKSHTAATQVTPAYPPIVKPIVDDEITTNSSHWDMLIHSAIMDKL